MFLLKDCVCDATNLSVAVVTDGEAVDDWYHDSEKVPPPHATVHTLMRQLCRERT